MAMPNMGTTTYGSQTHYAHADSGHFLRIRQWGGHLQKGTILYQVWRNDRWLLVTKSFVWYRI